MNPNSRIMRADHHQSVSQLGRLFAFAISKIKENRYLQPSNQPCGDGLAVEKERGRKPKEEQS